MSQPLEGMHYCKDHQGNHSHYAVENCEVCRLRAEVASLKETETAYYRLLELESSDVMVETLRQVDDLTQQLAAANGRAERIQRTFDAHYKEFMKSRDVKGLLYSLGVLRSQFAALDEKVS